MIIQKKIVAVVASTFIAGSAFAVDATRPGAAPIAQPTNATSSGAEKTTTSDDSPKILVGDALNKGVKELKSIAGGLTHRKEYSKPEPSMKEVKKAIPTIPASVLRGGVQSKADTDALKATAAALNKTTQSSPQQTTSGVVRLITDSTIHMQPGGNVYIPISRDHPNRLITPFSHPQVISTSLVAGKKGECGEVCVRDGIIYITTDSTQPVTAFITQKGNEEVAFSVTMLPRAIPPREIHFTLPKNVADRVNMRRGSRSGGNAEAWETEQPYVDTIKKALRSVALQEIPPGYAIRAVKATDPIPACRHPGLNIEFRKGQVLEGHNLDIYVGVITNVSDKPVEFREQACGGWRTAAVTSWPLKVLEPQEQTEIYIITKRDEEIAPDSMRRPLVQPRKYN